MAGKRTGHIRAGEHLGQAAEVHGRADAQDVDERGQQADGRDHQELGDDQVQHRHGRGQEGLERAAFAFTRGHIDRRVDRSR